MKTLLLWALLPLLLVAAPSRLAADTLTLANGDTVSGKLVRGDANGITFDSALAGTLTIAWKNLRGLQAAGPFAVIGRDHAVHEGALSLAASGLQVGAATVPVAEVDTILDAAAYHRATRSREPWQDWRGNLGAGVSLVSATQSSQSLNAALDLQRPVPGVPGLAPRANTLLHFHGTYGSLQQPGAPSVRTSIYSTGAEQDENVSAALFLLGSAQYDHNYSQGLQLQQVYGGGLGWTLVHSAAAQWDVKADFHWTRQSFLSAPADQFVASTVAEHGQRRFGKLLWTETASAAPAYNHSSAFQAAAQTGWALPVWRGWAVNVTLADNYLGNPQPGFQHNSLQFATALQFAIK